ncbi:MAG TPA: response regulator, partial [Nitrospira sp.]|nr:response regulator [Nitrospira sp.]
TIRERIEALHGTFDVCSKIGEGTTVSIRIPITPLDVSLASPRQSSRAASVPPSTGPHIIRTLIVDDHTMMRQGLKTLLGGYADIEIIGEAANGQEAVERALQSRPDLIVMDVNMPLLNGVAATKEICTLLPKTKVIGLSYDMSTSRSMCEAGAVTCLDKAFAIEQLYQVISQVGGGSDDVTGIRDPAPVLQ